MLWRLLRQDNQKLNYICGMATLNVTITEEVEINGANRGSTVVNTIPSVTYTYHQVMPVTNASEVTVVSFSSAAAGAVVIPANAKYLRITNITSGGSDYPFNLRVRGTNEEYFVRLNTGKSFILNTGTMDANDETNQQNVSLANIVSIKALGTSAGTAILEVFAAS